MPTLQVANIDFTSTKKDQIIYSANTLTIKAGGVNVFTVNSTTANALVSTNVSPGAYTTSGTITANTISLNSGADLIVTNQVNLNGMVTPTAINASTADFAPPVTNTAIVRFSANSSNNSALSIYGMTAGVNGQVIILSNIGTKAVTLTSEDATNEATAANRFRLASNINVTVNGYQSLSLYYDGNVSRWIPVDQLGTALLPPFYKGCLTKGFFAGGKSCQSFGLDTTRICRTTYSTETLAAVPTTVLTLKRSGLKSNGNSLKGFFAGGITECANPPFCCTTIYDTTNDKITYSSEVVAAAPLAVLSQARYCLLSAGNVCKGFFSGGYVSAAPNISAVSDRTTYSTETTAAVPGANLIQARMGGAAIGNSCKSLNGGGSNSTTTPYVTGSFERITFATETTASIPAVLGLTRTYLASAGNVCKGFFSGGATPNVPLFVTQVNACRVTFSSETVAAVPGANLTQSRGCHAASGNACKGFFTGGFKTPAPGIITAVSDRTTYSTETTAAVPGANLLQARYMLAAV